MSKVAPESAGNRPEPGESPAEKRDLHRCIAGSAIGNMTEWFDYGAYGYVTGQITTAFFPSSTFGAHPWIATALVFAVSFLFRPLGGMVWGPIGDRIGRQKVMATTIILMAACTFLVGCLPTYNQIGWVAVALLIALRMVQGFSTGGEYGGAATFMAEHAPDKKRGFYGSFLEFGTIAGFTLAVLIATVLDSVLSDGQMDGWGWRILFWLGGVLGLIGLYIRSKLEETPVFQELEAEGKVEAQAKTAFVDLLTGYWKPMLTLFGLVAALNVVNYTLLTYSASYLENEAGFSSSASGWLLTIAYAAMMVFLPFAGRLSDKIGRKPMWLFSTIALVVLSVPMYWLIGQGIVSAYVGIIVLGLVYVPQLATISATFPLMFPSQVRYGGMAITYNVSTALFGGTALYVNDELINWTGSQLMPGVYMAVASAVGLVATLFLKETAGKSCRGTELPGTKEQENELATRAA